MEIDNIPAGDIKFPVISIRIRKIIIQTGPVGTKILNNNHLGCI